MKKIIFLITLAIVGFFVWRYFKNPERKISPPEQAIDSAVNYVPNAIDRKKAMENNINSSVAKENEQLQKALDEIK